MTADPRVVSYARLLVERCVGAQAGWQVLVATTTEARALAEELSRQLARRGAFALTRIQFGAVYPVDAAWIAAAPAELAGTLAPLDQNECGRGSDKRADLGVWTPPERIAERDRHQPEEDSGGEREQGGHGRARLRHTPSRPTC